MRVTLPYSRAAEHDDGATPSPGTAEVGDLWKILWCRRRWVAGVMIVSLAGGVIYDALAKPQYTAAAQLLIDPRDRQIVTKDVNPDTLASDGGIMQIESQARVIESDAVLLRAVESAGLEQDPDFGAPKSTIFSALLEMVMGENARGSDSARNKALRALRKALTVKRADKVFVVDLSVKANTAAKAARVADAVADAYIADQVEARGQSSRRASDELAARLAGLRDSVHDAEMRVARYRADHDIVGTEKELVTDQQLGDVGTQLANAKAKTAELRARIDQIETARRGGGDGGAIPEALQSTVITQLRASAQDLQRRESDLRTRVGDRHPDLIALVQQVREVKSQINAELNRLARSARGDYDRALAYEKSLSLNLDTSKTRTISTNQASIGLRELDRDLDAKRSLYQAFLARSAETKAQADIDTSNARIISRAIPPDQLSWPPRLFILLGAFGGGLGLGMAFALILEYVAPTILSSSHLQTLADAPVLGVLSIGSRRSAAKARAHVPPGTDATGGAGDNETALALSRLCGPLAALRGVPDPYTLLLTSTQADGAARAEAVERLVAVAAERGVAVLMVQASPGHATMGAKGFLNVLRGESALGDVIRKHRTIGVKRLSIGTSAQGGKAQVPGTSGPSDEQIDQFIAEAGRYFDLIVFDGGAFDENQRMAPLLARADDVVLIAVAGVTRQKAARTVSHHVLASTGQPISASLLLQAA